MKLKRMKALGEQESRLDTVLNEHYTKGMNTKPKMTFALAGEIVSDAAHAKRILVNAIHKDKVWLVPQAESVLRQLRTNGQ